MFSRISEWPRWLKIAVVVLIDAIIAVVSTWIAYGIRMETLRWPGGEERWVYLIVPLVAIPVFWWFGLYRSIFRHNGLNALYVTGKAVLVYALLAIVIHLVRIWPTFPLTLGVLQPILFFLLISISRVVAKYWLMAFSHDARMVRARMLIYGAGAAGVQTASAIGVMGHFQTLGFIDDDPLKIGQSINGIPVYAASNIPLLVKDLGITDVLIAIPSATRARRNKIIHRLRALPVHTRTLPGLNDLATGRVSVEDFRELDLEDLLEREAVPANPDLLKNFLFGQTVLVTGAAGSIGSELCRQILQENPRRLLLLDHSEFGLYTIHRELQAWCQSQLISSTELVPLLASVVNRKRLDWICATYQPDTVFHAAAYKHVPMVECNPCEGIANNVFGTLNMAEAAVAARVGRFVLVSSDKAVRPTNVMGASKRMAELVLQALAGQSPESKTCFSMVRFGNVLGSSGSVIPMFREQISLGGPITVTHPQVTRYFMTIPEAAQLVLQASAMASGGEVFVLDMGDPVKIVDLAHRLVALSGLQVRDENHPDGDIEIAYIGLRPGEKLYEELLIGDNPAPTVHPRVMKAHEEHFQWPQLEAHLKALQQAAQNEDVEAVRDVLQLCVRGYGVSGYGVG